jgi:hypothetical protein
MGIGELLRKVEWFLVETEKGYAALDANDELMFSEKPICRFMLHRANLAIELCKEIGLEAELIPAKYNQYLQ